MPDTLKRTPLHVAHRALGARLVPFSGWEMPVQYAGVIDEVRAVREDAGVFDVSHMGQVFVGGAGAHAYLQAVLSNDLDRIGAYEAQYTLLPNEAGGIVDDLIAYRRPDGGYLLVVNAGNIAADVAHLEAQRPGDATLDDRSDQHGMVALQGPKALGLLAGASEPADGEGAVGDPAAMAPFTWGRLRVAGVECTVARTGYTGEPGAELICPAGDIEAVWNALIAAGAAPCGLGARDVLRLEVCYPLHGNDITPETNAIEAGLGWVCALGKDFTGAAPLRRTKEAGPERRLVAFRMDAERTIPRGGCSIGADDGAALGTVTSGGFSPTLGIGIGMGYVAAAHAAPGTHIAIDIRGREAGAVVARKPLYTKEQ